jgi:hypothetical protein
LAFYGGGGHKVEHNRFENCRGRRGGAIYSIRSITIQYNIFFDNVATVNAGAIYVQTPPSYAVEIVGNSGRNNRHGNAAQSSLSGGSGQTQTAVGLDYYSLNSGGLAQLTTCDAIYVNGACRLLGGTVAGNNSNRYGFGCVRSFYELERKLRQAINGQTICIYSGFDIDVNRAAPLEITADYVTLKCQTQNVFGQGTCAIQSRQNRVGRLLDCRGAGCQLEGLTFQNANANLNVLNIEQDVSTHTYKCLP